MSPKMDSRTDPQKGKQPAALTQGPMPKSDRFAVLFSEIEDVVTSSEKCRQMDFHLTLARLKYYDLDSITKAQGRTLKKFARLGIAEVLTRSEYRRDDLASKHRNEYFRDLECAYGLAELVGLTFSKSQVGVIQQIFSRGVSKALSEVSYNYRDVFRLSALTGIQLSGEQEKRIKEIGASIIAKKITEFYHNKLSPQNVFSEIAIIHKVSKETFSSLTEGQKNRIYLFGSHLVNQLLDEGKFVDPKYIKLIGMPLTKELYQRLQKAAHTTVDRIAGNLNCPLVQVTHRYVIEGVKKINYIVEATGIKLTSEQRKKLQQIGLLHATRACSYFIENGRVTDPGTAKEIFTLAELTNYKLDHHQKSLLNAMAGGKNKK